MEKIFVSAVAVKNDKGAKQMKLGLTCSEQTQLRNPSDAGILEKVCRDLHFAGDAPQRGPKNKPKATLFPYFSNGSFYMCN